MAQPFVNGPAHLFVRFPGQSQPLYLGTSKDKVTIDFRPEWEPVMNSFSGTKVPYDMAYQGEWAVVQAVLTRWNEPQYINLARYFLSASGRGLDGSGEIGALMITESLSPTLWVQSPYGLGGLAGKPAFTTMPGGYRFPATWLLNHKLDDLGTKNKEIPLTWMCLPSRLVIAGVLLSGLYDHDMTGLPLPD